MRDTPVRAGLPPLPERVRRLPVDGRGFPVPWFVAWLDEHGAATPRGIGQPDFRVVYPGAGLDALRRRVCWVCGQTLGRFEVFVIGPMCAVNRTSAEPPCHRDCAVFAATACPFLVRPHARRRDAGLPDGTVDAPGVMIKRNPGVTALWTTRRHSLFHDGDGGVLIEIGDPDRVEWLTQGRPATREEVQASIDEGLPALSAVAREHNQEADLERCVRRVAVLLPASW